MNLKCEATGIADQGVCVSVCQSGCMVVGYLLLGLAFLHTLKERPQKKRKLINDACHNSLQ